MLIIAFNHFNAEFSLQIMAPTDFGHEAILSTKKETKISSLSFYVTWEFGDTNNQMSEKWVRND